MSVCRSCNAAVVHLLAYLLLLVPAPVVAQNWVISGVILDSAGGPIQGADLDLFEPDTPATEIPVTGDSTDTSGSFSMLITTVIPNGTYTLEINPPPGFLSTELALDLDGDLDVGAITIGSGWIITGMVEDTIGNPLSPIDIDIRGNNTGWLDLTGDFTQPDGTFCLTIPALVDEYRFVYRMSSPFPTVFPLEVNGVFLFGDTDVGTNVMELAHTLTGTVVNEDGVPVPGIDMNIYDAQGIETDLNNDNTDANGNFSVLVPEGTWDVVHRQVTAAGNDERVPHAFLELVVVKDLDLGIVVLPLGYHVIGEVVGSASEQLADANLDAEYAATGIAIYLNNDVTTPAGLFDILLPPGLMDVEVDPPPTGPVRQSQLVQVEVTPGPPIDLGTIVLPDAVLLSGRCIDIAGIPIPFVDVELLISATGASYPTIHENGGPDGNFSVAVDPDIYDLVLIPSPATGLGPFLLEQIQVLSNTDLGDLPLPAGVTLSGTVSAMAVLLEGATVQILHPVTGNTPPWGTTLTDALGVYSLAIAPGIWDVSFTAPPGSGIPSHIETNLNIFSDQIFDIDLVEPPQPVGDLSCILMANEVALEWINSDPDYDSLAIVRNGILLATLPGTQTTYSDTAPLAGQLGNYEVFATRSGIDSEITSCALQGPPAFIRCDAGNDNTLSIADAVSILSYLFASAAISCEDSADCNDSGAINIADAVRVLQYLFGGGDPPPPPFPDSGLDPTPDSLGC